MDSKDFSRGEVIFIFSFLFLVCIILLQDSVPEDIQLGKDKLCECMHKLLNVINDGNKKLIVKNLRDR